MIAVYVKPEALTVEQYNKARKGRTLLEQMWRGARHHSCFGEDGQLMVYEIWDSQENYHAFGKFLMARSPRGRNSAFDERHHAGGEPRAIGSLKGLASLTGITATVSGSLEPGRPGTTTPMADHQIVAAEDSAVRVALWRALHVEVDPATPCARRHGLGLGNLLRLKTVGATVRTWIRPGPLGFGPALLLGPDSWRTWLQSKRIRALASTSSWAPVWNLRPAQAEIASRLRVFEVDQPGPQAWKRQRLIDLGFGVPEWLRLVPLDFEAGGTWWDQLAARSFDPGEPAVVVSTGVTMYLTKDATAASRPRAIAGGLAAGLHSRNDISLAHRAHR